MSESGQSSHPILKRLDRGEDILLCLLLTFMLSLACVQILLRSVFSSGLLWADPLLRYLVLWCGLLGALKATGQRNHIALDLSNYLVPKSAQPWITLVTDLFCTITTAGLSVAAWIFIKNEIEFGGTTLLSLPVWVWNIIFPITFGLMTVRYGIRFVINSLSHFRSLSQKRGHNQ